MRVLKNFMVLGAFSHSYNLMIERGRHHNIHEIERICPLCKKKSIENVLHFLLNCDLYKSFQTDFEMK